MKRPLIALFLLLFITSCAPTDDKTAIDNLNEAYLEAFNNHEAEKIATLWSDDGTIVNFNTLERIQGKTDFIPLYKQIFKKLHGKKIKLIVDRITFKDSNLAFSEGTIQILNHEKVEEIISFKAEYIKIQDTWKVGSLVWFKIK